MTTTDIEKKIQEAEAKLKLAEMEHGLNDPRVADCLEECASLFKSNKIRLLDAANMAARARVIRDTTPQPEPPRQDSILAAPEVAIKPIQIADAGPGEPPAEFKLCPFCAEQVKAAAIKCKHCGESLETKREKQPQKEKTIGELISAEQNPRKEVQDLSSKDLGVLTFEFNRQRKSVGVAYLLCIFLGVAGIHKFYLNSVGAGLFYLLLLFTWWLIFPPFILGLLIFIDLFTLLGQVEGYNNRLKRQIVQTLRG